MERSGRAGDDRVVSSVLVDERVEVLGRQELRQQAGPDRVRRPRLRRAAGDGARSERDRSESYAQPQAGARHAAGLGRDEASSGELGRDCSRLFETVRARPSSGEVVPAARPRLRRRSPCLCRARDGRGPGEIGARSARDRRDIGARSARYWREIGTRSGRDRREVGGECQVSPGAKRTCLRPPHPPAPPARLGPAPTPPPCLKGR